MLLNKYFLVLASLFLSTNALADLSSLPSGKYNVDPMHGYILFSYSHFGLSNPQVGFNKFSASIDLDADAPVDSTIDVTVDVASIDSRVELFDSHLTSADWFNAEAHPEITFTATTIGKTESGYSITGDLTIKGITKVVTLDAAVAALSEHPVQNVPAIGVSAKGMVKRSDFDLGAYAPSVSDDVTLMIEAEFLLK